MNKDEIIKMANDAGIKGPAPARAGFKMYANPQRLERFAELVAAREREACAKVCDVIDDGREDLSAECAEVIRARGEQ